MNNEERRNSPMKKLAVLLAALLVLSCGTTFLAAPSPELGGSPSPELGGTPSPELPGDEDPTPDAGTTTPDSGTTTPDAGTTTPDDVKVAIKDATAVDASGNVVKVILNKVTEAIEKEAADAAKEKSNGSQVLAIVDVKVEGATFPLTITFNVDGIKAADKGKIYLLHEKANGYWEVIHPSEVADGKIKATFDSLSPVAIVKVADATTTLPKTGAPVVLPVVALICAAGAAGCAKKVKFN